MSDSEGRSGFWGTTLNRLKAALVKTKDQVGAEEAFEHPEVHDKDGAQTATAAAATSTTSISQPPSGSIGGSLKTEARVEAKQRVAKPVDEDFIETLEDRLIKADLGVGNVSILIDDLRSESKGKSWTSLDVENFLKREFARLLSDTAGSALSYKEGKLNVYLVVGVNGVGKTTSIGKLAARFKSEGKKVLLAAGDTFRAAAESQLEIWSQRANVDIVRLQDGADPGAVVYQALAKGHDEKYDALIIDTAGRLHNKTNLMAELKKIRSVVDKQKQDANVESFLVLDASTGQNGLQQAKVFAETCGLTGVILTKLDGTAKGGVVFAIARELKIPVKLIGIGEKMEDLRDFDPDMFVEALF
ncbi:MAG: signal recognition particle-docking protein FtsY [Cyanobacteria bacterium REEB67]|nr:signal recognition particle-docking protein FtsY [Cyanobacteria bacterium REEB67]